MVALAVVIALIVRPRPGAGVAAREAASRPVPATGTPVPTVEATLAKRAER